MALAARVLNQNQHICPLIPSPFKMEITSFFSLLLLFFVSFKPHHSIGADAILKGGFLSGNQTITSQGGNFELGFFSPGNSQKYYIGIWYKKLPNQSQPNKTVVWVANRNKPIFDSFSSQLKFSEIGSLVLINESKSVIWSTKNVPNVRNSTIAVLLDNGNFVIRDILYSSQVVWQSFDYPTNTWLPGGKIGVNKLRNERQVLTNWKNSENPAAGVFSVEVESNGTSHILKWNGSETYWTTGEWTGKFFTQVPEIVLNYYITNLTYISNENESYFTYDAASSSSFTRFVLDVNGQLRQFVWAKDFDDWHLFWIRPTQVCEVYGFCGGFSICQQDVPICDCIEGFEPKVIKDWNLGEWAGGCVRKTPLTCEKRGNDAFSLKPNTRFPDNSESSTVDGIQDCELACSGNCSCIAYAYNDSGCFIWKNDLFNLEKLSSSNSTRNNFYVRVATSELVETRNSTDSVETRNSSKTSTSIIFGLVFGGAFIFIIFFATFVVIIKRRKRSNVCGESTEDFLMLFRYRDLKTATRNFSEKLGQGGFGAVYKGKLPNSLDIAVKELHSLNQGEKQFRAEVTTIGTIQHVNLVRLRGFCIESSKRLLVYDYMPNGSLESHLFKRTHDILNWKMRFNIAIGIARGLAYLHEKCRDLIIHCDIKPENILLDSEYSPKVADFGLAKLLGRDFSRILTTIRGTRGYLAPEWISGEAITPKADVFSYGMLLFEIISGKRNQDLLYDGTEDYFPTRVAKVLNNNEMGELINLLDYRLEGAADIEEVIRACKVACWCIQDLERDRPTMETVVQSLEGVSQLNVPPIPQFLQLLEEVPMEASLFNEISSSMTL